MFPMLSQLLKQMVKKPFTNLFPAKYAPKKVRQYLEDVQKGKAKLIPPVPPPDLDAFRGKISYEKDKCIGCKLCVTVCPAKAIEFKEKDKKIRIYIGRCIFCAQCNDVCPVSCLHMGQDFLLADADKISPNLIVE